MVMLTLTCGCGLAYTLEEYLALPKPVRGDTQPVAEDLEACTCGFAEFLSAAGLDAPGTHLKGCPGAPHVLTYRDCPCTNTMARRLPE